MTTFRAEAELGEPPAAEVWAEVWPHERSTLGLLELLLKDRGRVDRLLREPARQREMIPRFLALGLSGFAPYGLAATVVLNAVLSVKGFWPVGVPAAHFYDRTAPSLLLAYCLGLVASNGVCLPSFYFYGLLAGVETTMLGVTAHAMKGLASAALALVGILPIYVAVALGAIVFPVHESVLVWCIALGLVLPFIAGLWGVQSLFEGFVCLADTIPAERRGARACFLRRLLFAWCACYTAVTPLMIYTLWNRLSFQS